MCTDFHGDTLAILTNSEMGVITERQNLMSIKYSPRGRKRKHPRFISTRIIVELRTSMQYLFNKQTLHIPNYKNRHTKIHSHTHACTQLVSAYKTQLSNAQTHTKHVQAKPTATYTGFYNSHGPTNVLLEGCSTSRSHTYNS